MLWLLLVVVPATWHVRIVRVVTGATNKVTRDEELSEGAPLGPAVTHVAVLTIFYVSDRTDCATVTRDSD